MPASTKASIYDLCTANKYNNEISTVQCNTSSDKPFEIGYIYKPGHADEKQLAIQAQIPTGDKKETSKHFPVFLLGQGPQIHLKRKCKFGGEWEWMTAPDLIPALPALAFMDAKGTSGSAMGPRMQMIRHFGMNPDVAITITYFEPEHAKVDKLFQLVVHLVSLQTTTVKSIERRSADIRHVRLHASDISMDHNKWKDEATDAFADIENEVRISRTCNGDMRLDYAADDHDEVVDVLDKHFVGRKEATYHPVYEQMCYTAEFCVRSHTEVMYVMSVFHREGISCYPSVLGNDSDYKLMDLMVERFDRLHHQWVHDWIDNPATVKPRRDGAKNWSTQNFLTGEEKWAFSFDRMAQTMVHSSAESPPFRFLPEPLRQYCNNEEIHLRKELQTQLTAQRAWLVSHKVIERELRNFDPLCKDKDASALRSLLHTDDELKEHRCKEMALVRRLEVSKHDILVTPPIVQQCCSQLQWQLLTAFYHFEIARTRECRKACTLILSVARYFGMFVRWVNPYRRTGKRVGFGKCRRVFRSGDSTPGPGLNKTRNGRGFHCKKDSAYRARYDRRLENQLLPLVTPYDPTDPTDMIDEGEDHASESEDDAPSSEDEDDASASEDEKDAPESEDEDDAPESKDETQREHRFGRHNKHSELVARPKKTKLPQTYHHKVADINLSTQTKSTRTIPRTIRPVKLTPNKKPRRK